MNVTALGMIETIGLVSALEAADACNGGRERSGVPSTLDRSSNPTSVRLPTPLPR